MAWIFLHHNFVYKNETQTKKRKANPPDERFPCFLCLTSSDTKPALFRPPETVPQRRLAFILPVLPQPVTFIRLILPRIDNPKYGRVVMN